MHIFAAKLYCNVDVRSVQFDFYRGSEILTWSPLVISWLNWVIWSDILLGLENKMIIIILSKLLLNSIAPKR